MPGDPAGLLIWLSLLLRGMMAVAELDPDLAYAEKSLREAHVATDGRGLLDFFRARTLSDEARARLGQTVRELGHQSFAIRQRATQTLRAAGRAARVHLLEALKNPDPEIVHRAEDCLAALNDNSEAVLITHAARVLSARRPPGATAVLLAYLPSVDTGDVEDAVLSALAAVGTRDGRADEELLAALSDKESARRAGAAYALAGVMPEQRRGLEKLLTDPEPRVRFQAAAALVRAADARGVPPLLALVDEAPMTWVHEVEDILFRLATDEVLPSVSSSGDAVHRRTCRDAWETWWKTNAGRVDLASVNRPDALLGLTIICEYDNSGKNGMGRIWECGPDGKMRWQIDDVHRPMDVQVLRGGRLLIAENGGRVTERDRQGRVLWEQKVPSPVCCQRLANGNTFVANYTELFEFTRDGKVVFNARQNQGGSIYYAQKLRTGNYLFIQSSGRIVELDGNGKEVRSFSPESDKQGCGYWAAIEALNNGRYLVALGSSHKVAEIDTAGKLLWSCKVPNTTGATRLRNGNTLCVSTEGRMVIEFDRDGKEVWKQATQGRPFRVRRY